MIVTRGLGGTSALVTFGLGLILGSQAVPFDAIYGKAQFRTWTGDGNIAVHTVDVVEGLVYYKEQANWSQPIIVDTWTPATVSESSSVRTTTATAIVTQGLSATWIKPSSIHAQWAVPVSIAEWNNAPVQATWINSVVEASWIMSPDNDEQWAEETVTDEWIKS